MGSLVMAGDDGLVFEAESVERGAGSQGWAKCWFPSWETERIANSDPERFRFNLNLTGPENQPGNWEYLTEEGGEWLPVEWQEDHGVGSWVMAPQWEWRAVTAPSTEADIEEWYAHIDRAKGVHEAQEAHCNLYVHSMKYKTGEF